ncbi:hypothetical protein Cpir12675_003509 [Ceratocystis pirilliformis]|uniref:Uncharacterized protein n=1 Tax=Ceratocystis pirilliformis TaxID=259994 RepID=A0ABR3Z5N0_9PEZI
MPEFVRMSLYAAVVSLDVTYSQLAFWITVDHKYQRMGFLPTVKSNKRAINIYELQAGLTNIVPDIPTNTAALHKPTYLDTPVV